MSKVADQNEGSEWKKWDLHLHSFFTSLNNQFTGITEDQYIDKIVAGDIKVVDLTNYGSPIKRTCNLL